MTATIDRPTITDPVRGASLADVEAFALRASDADLEQARVALEREQAWRAHGRAQLAEIRRASA